MRLKLHFITLLGLFLLLLLASGCDLLAQRWSGQALPTTTGTTQLAQASPETAAPAQPSATPSQDAPSPAAPLPSPTPTLKPPTPLPSPSPDPYLTPRPNIPEGEISFIQPAPLSRLTSPMWVIANLAPGADDVFRVDLLGEDGRLLSSKVLTYAGQRLTWTGKLDFEIAAAAETARLQIVTLDEFGRTQALASTEIILLSVGTEEVFEASDTRERIYIAAPLGESVNQGSSLLVSGRARPNPLMNLYVELIDQKGKVVGQRTIGMESVPGEDYARFSGEVPYTVTQATPVRLTIYERASRIPGYTHISTRLIVLVP